MTRGELADKGPTYVSVAGIDGFYADALCDVFGASSVSAKAGEVPRPGNTRTGAEEGSHVCQSCVQGISCQQVPRAKQSKSGLTPYPSWGISWPLGSLTLVWRVNWEAMLPGRGGEVSSV